MNTEDLVSIQKLSQACGVSSRTLRHYDEIGLLKPKVTNNAGLRYYSQHELLRLQQILVMRKLGLSLEHIKDALNQTVDFEALLAKHLRSLQANADGIQRMIRATKHTLENSKKGKRTQMSDMFDGFDHTQYKDEVEERWGSESYQQSDKWWRPMGEQERKDWGQRSKELIEEWRMAAEDGLAPSGAQAQALARRQEEWLGSIPGTPGYGTGVVPAEYLLGLAEMYVADPRFAANYGGETGARFVKAAIEVWVANR
ncbi:MAG: hypothetical protein RI917_678 [Actinomycetota bacterium]